MTSPVIHNRNFVKGGIKVPIRPIDIVKSHEFTQYKHQQNQKVQHEQVQISKSFQNLLKSEASRPVETTKSENNEFRYDAKEESRNSYNGSGKKRQDKHKDEKEPGKIENTGRPGGIDILI